MYKLCSLYTQWDKTHHGYAVKPWQRKCKISWSLLWCVQPLSLDISQTQQDTSVTFPGWPGMPFAVASWNTGYCAKLFWPIKSRSYSFSKIRTCQFDIRIVTLGWKLIIKVSTVPRTECKGKNCYLPDLMNYLKACRVALSLSVTTLLVSSSPL